MGERNIAAFINVEKKKPVRALERGSAKVILEEKAL